MTVKRRWTTIIVAVLLLVALAVGVGIWIRIPKPHMEPVPVVEYPDQQNPYSIRVKQFRRAADAERAASRLRKDTKQPAFVVKRDLKKGGTWFEVHLGPWPTEEAAKTAETNVKAGNGITQAKTVELASYEQSVDQKALEDARAAKRPLDPVVVDLVTVTPQNQPNSVTPQIANIMANFPVNQDLAVIDMAIINNEALKWSEIDASVKKTLSDNLDGFYFPKRLTPESLAHKSYAAVAAKFEDKLYGTRFSLLVTSPISADDSAASTDELYAEFLAACQDGYAASGYAIETAPAEITVSGQKYKGERVVARKQGATTLTFLVFHNSTTKLVFLARGLYETTEFLTKSLSTEISGKGLIEYGEVTAGLYALPESGDENALLTFRLVQIGDDYVAEKNYADWAKAMLGYWSAVMFFVDHGDLGHASIFDLRTTARSDYIYKTLYSNANQRGRRIAARNPFLAGLEPKPIKIRGSSGWHIPYHILRPIAEVNFSTGRYVAAVSTVDHKRDTMERVASRLQIFPELKEALAKAPEVSAANQNATAVEVSVPIRPPEPEQPPAPETRPPPGKIAAQRTSRKMVKTVEPPSIEAADEEDEWTPGESQHSSDKVEREPAPKATDYAEEPDRQAPEPRPSAKKAPEVELPPVPE